MGNLNLFISYSHQESEPYITDLLKYLNEQNCSNINIWYDEKISPGSDWDDAIKNSLNSADIVLLMVSQSFLNSRYIKEKELSIAMKRHVSNQCRLIPIFTRKCFLDNYPEIKSLQGLPRNMNFISDMGEEKWRHYTEIVQHLNEIAFEIQTQRNISNSLFEDDATKAGDAKTIEGLMKNNQIFLSIPSSEEGRKKRRDLIIQVEGKIKYENWSYEIVPGIKEAAEIMTRNEQETIQTLKATMSKSLYSIHIISSSDDLKKGLDQIQYDHARKLRETSTFFKSIMWLLSSDLKASLDEEVTMNPIAVGNDYDNIFELINYLDSEKEKKIDQLKKSFSPAKKVYMFYDFMKDHDCDLRIKLKTKIEENENLTVRFSPPLSTLEKEKEDLDKCEGGFIFYGTADPQWFAYRQSILLDAGFTKSKAICVDEPEIDKKIDRDISKNAFITIKGKSDLDFGVKNFLERLQNGRK